jgi:hypothetical protein
VLVFHDSSQDLEYLKKLGFNVWGYMHIIEIADTRYMYQYVKRSQDATALRSVLAQLDIPFRYLHNAGNDAVYTLRSMISLSVKKRLDSIAKAPKKVDRRLVESIFEVYKCLI